MAEATGLVYGFATEAKATHGIFLWRMRDLRCKGKIVIKQNISGQDRDCANIDLQITALGPTRIHNLTLWTTCPHLSPLVSRTQVKYLLSVIWVSDIEDCVELGYCLIRDLGGVNSAYSLSKVSILVRLGFRL
ncbi:hypothetical protein M0R45_023777 [Rubus argutus]|uniref:Uncharacterized protein n=1 Tax=Rubus argutus TaxID=59490 RepID=A0AAW1WR80_RUBAR